MLAYSRGHLELDRGSFSVVEAGKGVKIMALPIQDAFYRPSKAPAYRSQKITYTRWQLLKRAWFVLRGKVDLESYDNLRGENNMLRWEAHKAVSEVEHLKATLAQMDNAQRAQNRQNKLVDPKMRWP